jgi:hypothetical protein
MQPGYVCVAGVDVDVPAVRHIRPVLAHDRLGAALLRRNGGPFEMASVVNLGVVRYAGQAPEVEDYLFDPSRAARLGPGGPENFWKVLTKAAQPRLRDIFGPALAPRGRTCAVDVGAGTASLGCLWPSEVPSLYLDPAGRPRLRVSDGELAPDLPVTDLRLFEADQVTVRGPAVEYLAERIRDGAAVLLSVGLTRPWRKPDDAVERHWLQINNVHLAENPTWDGELA